MPAAIKKSIEYGDDLVVLLVESQGTSRPNAEWMQYDKGWMAGNAFWTHERPLDSGARGLPNYVLLGVNGEVLMKGHPMSDKSKIEDAIEEQIKLAKKLPGDVPKSAKKVWSAYLGRDYVKGLETLAKLEAKGEEGLAPIRERLETKIEAEFTRVDTLIDMGYLTEAQDLAEALHDEFEDHEAFGQRAADNLALFEGADMDAELDAATAFAKLYEKVCENGVDDSRKKLDKFAAKHSGTKAAERAQYLLELRKG